MNKNTNFSNSPGMWSREISRENCERKGKRYGRHSEKFTVYIIGISEGEKQMRWRTNYYQAKSLVLIRLKDLGNDGINEWRRKIASPENYWFPK